MIAIVDVGLCNAGSIANMLRVLGVEAVRTDSPEAVQKATKLILPGVGSFDAGRTRLDASGLLPILKRRVLQEQIPVLGICLGMQLMTEGSEEGEMAGLAWIPAQTRRFSFSPGTKPLRVPHMGWNDVEFRPDSPMAANMPPNPRFYFVHSYHVTMANEDQMWMGRTVYGFRFVSGFSSGNIHGVQFHPEKSHKFGLQFLRNFASLT